MQANPELTGFDSRSLSHIQECFPDTKISLLDPCGISAASKEATSFAFMGFECLVGRPLIITKIEVPQPTIMGKITPGRNYLKIIDQISAFHKKRIADNGADAYSWLPATRDLRVWNNRTRAKELEDQKLH